NRRIFRGMVVVADSESWQRIFQLMKDNSRWDLPDDDVAMYLARSFDYIIDFLLRVDRSEPYALDPSGDETLRDAKRVRRAALRSGGEAEVQQRAERRFGMPTSSLRYASDLKQPLYVPARSASS
ncbi:MAG TPA: hypothetical protein VIV65_12305, partial [Gemmatimonadaceae bacterium]